MSILVPRIWFQVPHPSNGQNISKTKPFRRQKQRFPDGAQLRILHWVHLGIKTSHIYTYIGSKFHPICTIIGNQFIHNFAHPSLGRILVDVAYLYTASQTSHPLRLALEFRATPKALTSKVKKWIQFCPLLQCMDG